MSKVKRLRSVLELLKCKEKNAAIKLGQCLQKQQSMLNNLNNLHQFHDEYSQRLTQKSSLGMDARQLHQYRLFLAQIDNAILKQQASLAQAERDAALHQQKWHSSLQHKKGVEQVLQTTEAFVFQRQMQREQLENDERAGRGKKKFYGEA